MHVGLVAPPWIPIPPPAYGGTESVISVLAAGLVAAGAKVTLAGHPESTQPAIHLVPCPAPPAGAFIGTASVEATHALHAYRSMVDARVDVIHDHTTIGVLVAGQLAEEAGIPVVTTNHNPFDDLTDPILARAANRATVVGISHDQASRARAARVSAVIHHGIDTAAVPVGAGDGGYLAFLGRFNPAKGATTAIRVARAAGIPLLMAAKMWEPSEQQYFATAIEPQLDGAIQYVGELDATDKLDLLGRAVALLNPIRWDEPFGLNMIEALACGTPVIATPRGAAVEIVDHGTTGFVGASLAELVDGSTASSGLSRDACRRAAERRFSADRLAAEHLELYQRVLAHGGWRDVPDPTMNGHAEAMVTARPR